jgi:HTH-type transcriptional repressor of NAD biosynthesis genes
LYLQGDQVTIPRPVGLAVGKFYPPHAGHSKLIKTMLDECPIGLVAVCHSSVENIDVNDRIAWLKDEHPRAIFFPVFDDTPVEYTDETWGWFLDALTEGLNTVCAGGISGYDESMIPYPNVVYSGEHYASEFAERLDRKYDDYVFRSEMGVFPAPGTVTYQMLDRTKTRLSASNFRADPQEWWDKLIPAARAALCKRVVICGAESTGTTTLAKDLGRWYQTTVVPEYGRHFDWAVGKWHEWTSEDFTHIAREQKRWEDNLARRSRGGLLVCDTDRFATAMFHGVYLGLTHGGILKDALATPADLYLVTDHVGVEFEDDGTRLNSGKRAWMTSWFMDTLPPGRTILVTGSRESRLAQAVNAIIPIMTWDIADPIEYAQAAA